jgi:hypothetical protein
LSLNRLIVSAVLVVVSMAHGEEAKCPSYKDKSPLSTVVLFDGPPEQRADLMPDVSKGRGDHAYASWDVSYVFDSGRNLFLVCRFAGMTDTDAVTVKVEKRVQRCIYRTHGKGKPAQLTCR